VWEIPSSLSHFFAFWQVEQGGYSRNNTIIAPLYKNFDRKSRRYQKSATAFAVALFGKWL